MYSASRARVCACFVGSGSVRLILKILSSGSVNVKNFKVGFGSGSVRVGFA